MLINQARNLASQPYSALAQLEQSISQTEQLLMQAQRIAYSVTTIDQAFTQSYPQAYSSSPTSQQLLAGAQTRWQNSLAGFQDAMRVQAGAVQNLDSTRTQINSLISASQSATGALQAAEAGNQLTALQTKQLADLTAVMAAIARAQSLEGARNVENQLQAQQQLSNFPQLRPRLPAWLRTDVPLMRGRPFQIQAIARVTGYVVVAAAIAATAFHFRHDGTSASAPVRMPAAVSDPLAPELARCQAIGDSGKGRRRLRRPRGPRTAAGFFTYRPAGNAARTPPTDSAAGRQARGSVGGIGRHRRHRQLPRRLHAVYRFRFRSRAGRRPMARRRADRHRHHTGGALLGDGAGRGCARAADQEDALYRRLRLHHRQFQQPRPDHLQFLRRPRHRGGAAGR